MPRICRFSKHILNKFLAPNVSEFRHAEIPDMSDEASAWLSKFFLNSVLRGSYTDPFRQYVFNYLRRVEGAHHAHQCARNATEKFLRGDRQSMSDYMMAIFHWESFLAQSWMAYALIEQMISLRPFKGKDGSVERAVNFLYNCSKHLEKTIREDNLPPDGTLPIWMEDDGLHGIEDEGLHRVDVILTWEETGAVLQVFSTLANHLEDPYKAVQKSSPANHVAS